MTAALTAGLIAALIVGLPLGWACYRLLLDRGRLLLRLSSDSTEHERPKPQGLPSGAFLSDFALATLPGTETETERVITLSGMMGQPLLLVFAHTDCLYSRLVAHELGRMQPSSSAPRPVIILMGALGDPAMTALWRRLPCHVLRDPDGQVARLTRVSATPAGYRVDGGRRTSGPLLVGPAALLATAQGLGSDEDLRPVAVTPLPARCGRLDATRARRQRARFHRAHACRRNVVARGAAGGAGHPPLFRPGVPTVSIAARNAGYSTNTFRRHCQPRRFGRESPACAGNRVSRARAAPGGARSCPTFPHARDARGVCDRRAGSDCRGPGHRR